MGTSSVSTKDGGMEFTELNSTGVEEEGAGETVDEEA
jgi:hypothetical protein